MSYDQSANVSVSQFLMSMNSNMNMNNNMHHHMNMNNTMTVSMEDGVDGVTTHANNDSDDDDANLNEANNRGRGSGGGPVVAGYRLGAVLGVGTYGEVRACVDVVTGERVAVKVIDLSRFNCETVELIQREIKILRLLKHNPHTIALRAVHHDVPYHGSWCHACACSQVVVGVGGGECASCHHSVSHHSAPTTRGVLLIVQELAAGGELYGVIAATGALEEGIARFYFRHLLAGLEHCHATGVVHRDLKPENLVLDPFFNLKLVDFGLASIVSSSAYPTPPASSSSSSSSLPITVPANSSVSLLHSGVGSQPYSAPEVYYVKELYGGRGYDGAAADVWSCAVILYVMLTGRPPFARPLSKTYNTNMKRCRHFVNLMKGNSYIDAGLSESAASMLSAMFKVSPSERLTLDQLKAHEWVNGPVPSADYITRHMQDKAAKVWASQDKHDMIDVLTSLRVTNMSPVNILDVDPFSHRHRQQSMYASSASTDSATTASAAAVNNSSSPSTSSRHVQGGRNSLTAMMSPVIAHAGTSPTVTSIMHSPSSSCPTSPSYTMHPNMHNVHMASPNGAPHVHAAHAHGRHRGSGSGGASDLSLTPTASTTPVIANRAINMTTSGTTPAVMPATPFTAGISGISMLTLADDERGESGALRHLATTSNNAAATIPLQSHVARSRQHQHDDDDDDTPLVLKRETLLNVRHSASQSHLHAHIQHPHSQPRAHSNPHFSSLSRTSHVHTTTPAFFVTCRSALVLLSSIQSTLNAARFSCTLAHSKQQQQQKEQFGASSVIADAAAPPPPPPSSSSGDANSSSNNTNTPTGNSYVISTVGIVDGTFSLQMDVSIDKIGNKKWRVAMRRKEGASERAFALICKRIALAVVDTSLNSNKS